MTFDSTRLSLLYDVHRVSYLGHEIVERSLEGHELSGTEFALYSFLVTQGPVTVSDVADGMATPIATTSKMLARVDERGHLARHDNPQDGRSTLVELSSAGRAVHKEAGPGFRDTLHRLQAELGGAIDDVRWALARLDHALSSVLEGRTTVDPGDNRPHRLLSYTGNPLAAAEEAEARRYIDWLRWQRQADA